MTEQEIIREWRNKGEIPTQDMIDQHGAETVWKYIEGCAATIANATPIGDGEDESWDDPEQWQIEAVVVAHGVKLLGYLVHLAR